MKIPVTGESSPLPVPSAWRWLLTALYVLLPHSGTVRAGTSNTHTLRCEAGIHLDGFKVVTAAWSDTEEGGSALCVYDTRWAVSGVAPAGLGPATVIPVEGRVVRFAACENSLILCTSDNDFQVSEWFGQWGVCGYDEQGS